MVRQMTEPLVLYRIRPATPADLTALLALDRQCSVMPWQEAAWRHDLAPASPIRCLVAEAPDGTIAGFAVCQVTLDEGEITGVAVHPACRQRGVARNLLRVLADQVAGEGVASLYLEVRAGNEPARRLYAAAGFQAVGHRRGYYADNAEDAIIMLKRLENTDA